MVILQVQGQAILTVKRGCVLSLWKKIEAIIEGMISLTLKSLVRASLVKHWTYETVKSDERGEGFFFLFFFLKGVSYNETR